MWWVAHSLSSLSLAMLQLAMLQYNPCNPSNRFLLFSTFWLLGCRERERDFSFNMETIIRFKIMGVLKLQKPWSTKKQCKFDGKCFVLSDAVMLEYLLHHP